MERSPSQDELTVMHQFDRLCQLALDGEAANYYRHMEYRRDHEVNFSEMTEKELDGIFVMDEYDLDSSHFRVLGYDIEVKDTLLVEALQALTEKKAECSPSVLFSGNDGCGDRKGNEAGTQHDTGA